MYSGNYLKMTVPVRDENEKQICRVKELSIEISDSLCEMLNISEFIAEMLVPFQMERQSGRNRLPKSLARAPTKDSLTETRQRRFLVDGTGSQARSSQRKREIEKSVRLSRKRKRELVFETEIPRCGVPLISFTSSAVSGTGQWTYPTFQFHGKNFLCVNCVFRY